MLNYSNSPLGKQVDYNASYNPDILFPISREEKRKEIGILPGNIIFYGFDLWNHYEVSWLNQKGKPIVAHAQISYDCNSPNIVESKSLKLYFNMFNQMKFETMDDLINLVTNDLTTRIGAPVKVIITAADQFSDTLIKKSFEGICIDGLDVVCDTYQVEPAFLSTMDEVVEETLCSDILRSNCLITNQPDWGSIQIHYRGKKIDREGLLKYFVSFRAHNEFHEQCIERIFMHLREHCAPEELTVYGRYTRRGGLDINPYRSSKPLHDVLNPRLYRQ